MANDNKNFEKPGHEADSEMGVDRSIFRPIPGDSPEMMHLKQITRDFYDDVVSEPYRKNIAAIVYLAFYYAENSTYTD